MAELYVIGRVRTPSDADAHRPPFPARADSAARRGRLRPLWLAIAWFRRGQVRAELMMLDERQRRDAGIPDEALAEALARPLSVYADQLEFAAGTQRTTRWRAVGAIVLLSVTAAALVPRPAAADEQALKACAALDLFVLAQIEEAELAAPDGTKEIAAAMGALTTARFACDVGAYAEAYRHYGLAEEALGSANASGTGADRDIAGKR